MTTVSEGMPNTRSVQRPPDHWRSETNSPNRTNGEIIGASSESYKSRKDCEANAGRNTAKDKWEFFKDKGGKHRWRALSNDNGRQVGKATEGFSSRKNAENNAKLNGWKG